jgi:hypothetical protein
MTIAIRIQFLRNIQRGECCHFFFKVILIKNFKKVHSFVCAQADQLCQWYY